MYGADKTDLETLQKLYPEMPESLIQLLSIVDGTYWREYEGKQYGIYFWAQISRSIHTTSYLLRK